MLCDPWCTPDDVIGGCTACTGDYTDAQLDTAIWVASRTLYQLTGRRWPGICTQTVRPTGGCTGDAGPPSRLLPGRSGSWRPQCCGHHTVALQGPVYDITEVVVDGVTLPETAYRVDDDVDLVRLDGGSWPCCQNLDLAVTEQGTFQVTYEWGDLIPDDAVTIAAVYACEIAKALCGDDTCRLAANVQSVTRQNVSIELIDPTSVANEGLTGIPEVDAWIRAINPERRDVSMMLVSPGMPRLVRASDPGGS